MEMDHRRRKAGAGHGFIQTSSLACKGDRGTSGSVILRWCS